MIHSRIKGFATLFSVIALGSVSLGLVIWVSTSSVWSLLGSRDQHLSAQARSLVNACAEIALENMRENTSYTGTNSVIIGSDACSYTITNNGGDSRSITISGSVGTITRKLEISTNAFNPLVIESWQEVP